MTKFDFLASLLDFGLGHVVEDVLELLDVEDLLSVQLVSKLWSVEQRKKATFSPQCPYFCRMHQRSDTSLSLDTEQQLI